MGTIGRVIAYQIEAVVPRSADEAFAELLDVGHYHEWVPGVIEAGYRSAGAPRAGHRGYEVRRLYGVRVESSLDLTEIDPPRRLALSFSSGRDVRGHATFTLEPADGGTRVHLAVELTGMALEPLARRLARRLDRKTLERLRQRLGG